MELRPFPLLFPSPVACSSVSKDVRIPAKDKAQNVRINFILLSIIPENSIIVQNDVSNGGDSNGGDQKSPVGSVLRQQEVRITSIPSVSSYDTTQLQVIPVRYGGFGGLASFIEPEAGKTRFKRDEHSATPALMKTGGASLLMKADGAVMRETPMVPRSVEKGYKAGARHQSFEELQASTVTITVAITVAITVTVA